MEALGLPRDRDSGRTFVGRSEELARLDAALAQACSGRPQVVVVEGDAGIGKTALLDAFLEAAGGGVVTLRARGDEDERDLSLGVVSQLAGGAQLADLAAWNGQSMLRSPASDLDPLVAGAQLLAFLSNLESAGDVVVAAIDDAHLADPPSTKALVFAARRVLADRALLLLTTRPGQLPYGWSQFLGGPYGTRLHLEGLLLGDMPDLASSLGVALSLPAAERLWQETDGHPLYAKALLAARGNQSPWAVGRSGPVPPPPALGTMVVSELERCPQEAQLLVKAAAVLGRRCLLGRAATVGRVRDVAGALQAAVQARLLVEVDGAAGREVHFPHALVRAAVHSAVGIPERVELHRRAAETSRGRPALEHRLAATLGVDETLAIELEAAAREEIRRGALQAGAEHLRQAASVSLAGPAADARVLEAVETWLIAGDADRASSLEERVLAAEPGPYREHVLGYLALVGGRLPEAEQAFLRAWDVLGELPDWAQRDDPAAQADSARPNVVGPEDLAGRIAVCMAILVVLKLDVDASAQWTAAAERHVMADPRATSFAWFCRALALGTFGRGTDALELLARPGAPDSADVLAARGMIEMWTDDNSAAFEHLSAAFARARAGELMRVTQALGFLAEVEYRLGHFAEAVVHADLAIQAAHDAGRVWDLPLLHSLAAYPSAARGDFDEAERHVRAAEDWAALVPIPAFQAYAAHARVALALARGDRPLPIEVVRMVDHAIERTEPGLSTFGPVLAEALLDADRMVEAGDALDAYEQRAARCDRQSALLGAARVRGLLLARRGDHRGAQTAFTRGRAIGRGLDLPLERARLEAAQGRAWALAGDATRARRCFEEAAAAFDRLGARPYAAATRAHLAGLSRPSPVPFGDGLTATERVVARLVGDGLSNREIAEQLVVSVKAVEYHLTNIYRQLGASSRVRLAQVVGRTVSG